MEYLFMEKIKFSHSYLATVQNEKKEVLFILSGSIGRKNDIIKLYAFNRVHLASIIQLNNELQPDFELTTSIDKLGTLKHLWHIGNKDAYYLTNQKMTVTGDINYQNYNVYTLNKKLMAMNMVRQKKHDYYQLAIRDGTKTVTCLLIAAVVNYLIALSESERQPHLRRLENDISIIPETFKNND